MASSHSLILLTAAALLCSGCRGDAPEPTPPARDMAPSQDMSAPTEDMSAPTEDMAPSCGELFGIPGESTGLSAERCTPRCSCGGEAWEAPTYTEDDVAALEAWTLLDPPALLEADPYQAPELFPPRPGAVCAVLFDDAQPLAYRLETYDSREAATAAGAQVTHGGACGRCSSLADLATYMRNPDLTTPVRECGIVGIRDGEEANLACLADLGFSPACAQIWYYNTAFTREQCLEECFAALNDPYHLEDGALNACLQCDEDLSGPVFKAVAGRTRRNSGLPSAICRPCETVTRVDHYYGE